MGEADEPSVTGDDEAGIVEALRPYLQLASSVTVARALEFAQLFMSQQGPQQAPVAASTVTGSDDVRAVARDEVSLALRRGHFVKDDELATLRREIERLEKDMAALRGQVADLSAQGATMPSGKGASGKKAKGAKPKEGGKHRGE